MMPRRDEVIHGYRGGNEPVEEIRFVYPCELPDEFRNAHVSPRNRKKRQHYERDCHCQGRLMYVVSDLIGDPGFAFEREEIKPAHIESSQYYSNKADQPVD